MHKVGVDLGYGFVKAVSSQGTRALFPSVFAPGHERRMRGLFGSAKAEEYMVTIRDAEGERRFFVGDLALREAKDAVRPFDQDRAFHRATKALLLAALVLVGAKGEVHVGTGIPFAQFSSYREKMRAALEGLEAEVEVEGFVPEERISVSRLTLFPQAAAAFYARFLSESGEVGAAPAESGMVGVVDIGYRTTDFLVVDCDEGFSVREALSGTVSIGMSDVLKAVHEKVEAKVGSYVDRLAVERALFSKEGTLFYDGTAHDLRSLALESSSNVASAIAERLKLVWGDDLRLVRKVCLAGGGASELSVHLGELHRNVEVIRDAQFANARGYLAVASRREMKERTDGGLCVGRESSGGKADGSVSK